MKSRAQLAWAASVVAGSTAAAAGQPDEAGFLWATVGQPGNAPVPAGVGGLAAGRGSVGYEFRISRLEVTTAQWMAFANAAGPLGDPFRIGDGPVGGYEPDPAYAGPGRRYRLKSVPGAERLPVYGISWLNAARYCNWLHNGREASLAALATGAYDASTFGVDPATGARTDALARLPGARYWVPSLDEWLKSAHYDPERSGPGQGGWWAYPTRSDAPPVSGPAGTPGAETNANLGGSDAASLLLGAYAGVRSAYGLWDLSGGASEWLEGVDDPSDRLYRLYDGSSAFDPFTPPALLDAITGVGSSPAAGEASFIGLRVASAVPDSGVTGCVLCGLLTLHRRRRPCRVRTPDTAETAPPRS